jgi:hypothetical protein
MPYKLLHLNIELHNFLASWQLYPEKGTYEVGARPKSSIYRIEQLGELLSISMHWVTLEDHAYDSRYTLIPNGEWQPCNYSDLADVVKFVFVSHRHFETHFARENQEVLIVEHLITPKGLLQVTQRQVHGPDKRTNVEVFHKQMSVLPYASSVAGAVVKKTEEGLIRHQALRAMDEQTNMQLDQIRQQVELLAAQAREIQKRKELSFIIYESKLAFPPVIGHTYFLYEKEDHSHLLSMIGPQEWGRRGCPYPQYISAVKLLADHTWVEV